MNNFKVAVVGLGGMGLRHCEAISQLDNVSLVSVCDIDVKRVKETSDKYGVIISYTDWKSMIKTESIDLIVIATNGDTHYDITTFAAENGVPRVLCEKPMTTSLSKAKKMMEICENNNTKLVVHHIRRWSESYSKLRDMITDGVIGDIRQITFEMGGGQMASNGGHLFDLVRFLTGEEPKKVIGFIDKKGTPNPRGNQFSDPGGYGIVWFGDDIRVFFDMSEDYGTPMLFKMLGSFGHIIVDEKAREWRISTRSDDDRNQPLTRRPNLIKVPFEGHGMMDMVDTCKKSIESLLNDEVKCSGLDGYKSLMIPIGVHKSDELGNVMIELTEDEENYKEHNFT
tara:strand:- start:55 stop:1074 length:1020 start_codon:yes stop_codon:yes gene_type:complete